MPTCARTCVPGVVAGADDDVVAVDPPVRVVRRLDAAAQDAVRNCIWACGRDGRGLEGRVPRVPQHEGPAGRGALVPRRDVRAKGGVAQVEALREGLENAGVVMDGLPNGAAKRGRRCEAHRGTERCTRDPLPAGRDAMVDDCPSVLGKRVRLDATLHEVNRLRRARERLVHARRERRVVEHDSLELSQRVVVRDRRLDQRAQTRGYIFPVRSDALHVGVDGHVAREVHFEWVRFNFDDEGRENADALSSAFAWKEGKGAEDERTNDICRGFLTVWEGGMLECPPGVATSIIVSR